MRETQNWSMAESGGRYVLDLEWKGEAKADITLGKFYVGGLFVRMPWRQGTRAEIVTEAGQRNLAAEQKRAKWVDLGIKSTGAKTWPTSLSSIIPRTMTFRCRGEWTPKWVSGRTETRPNGESRKGRWKSSGTG